MTRRDLEARYADKSTTPLPEPERLRELMRACGCGAGYLDIDAGKDSHEIVFGHRPHGAETGGGTEPSTPADRHNGRNLAPGGSTTRPVNTVPPPPEDQEQGA